MKKVNMFLSLISEKETHILYRLIKQSEIFQAFISWHDYGLQIMKTQNSVSQKIRILHKINKKGYSKQKCQASEKHVNFYALNTWLGLLTTITASMWRGMEAISLWHCSGVMEAQVTLIEAFRSSALLGQVSLIFLLTMPHRFSVGFRSGEFAGQSSTVTPWSLNQLLVPLAVCWSPAGK